MPKTYNPPLIANLQNGHTLATICDYYASCLAENEPANTFLRRRELHRPESIKTLCLGFGDRSLGKQFPPKVIKAGRELRDKLRSLGIIKATGHETLRGCVTIPLTDREGNTTGIYGRRVDDHTKGERHYRIMTRRIRRSVTTRIPDRPNVQQVAIVAGQVSRRRRIASLRCP